MLSFISCHIQIMLLCIQNRNDIWKHFVADATSKRCPASGPEIMTRSSHRPNRLCSHRILLARCRISSSRSSLFRYNLYVRSSHCIGLRFARFFCCCSRWLGLGLGRGLGSKLDAATAISRSNLPPSLFIFVHLNLGWHAVQYHTKLRSRSSLCVRFKRLRRQQHQQYVLLYRGDWLLQHRSMQSHQRY